MSSHREAPEISKDPVADSTDLYAFRCPDRPDHVAILANYIPLEGPAGGPNFYEFGDDVLYSINIDNNGDGVADVSYHFTFKTEITVGGTFLYNVGPIESLKSKSWNRRQTYSVSRVDHAGTKVLATGVPCPPCNIGPLSTPNYGSLAAAAVTALPSGRKVFAGQRADAFYVDLGAIFDLGDLRPIAELHNTFAIPGLKLSAAPGVNTLRFLNVHSIGLQVPIGDLTRSGKAPSGPLAGDAVVGIWTTASRRRARVLKEGPTTTIETGGWVQVSRLGNPLVNEVLVPMELKDYWNTQPPSHDGEFEAGIAHPQLAALLNVLYPGAFPNISGYTKRRADLIAVLLTGIPAGVVSPNFTTLSGKGKVLADMLRLNLGIPPTITNPKPFGVVAGDLAGFPNGRRVIDDVVSVELLAVAGAILHLVDPSFTPDKAIADVSDGLDGSGLEYLSSFPYLGTPYSGYAEPAAG